jgi:hypothetical protein
MTMGTTTAATTRVRKNKVSDYDDFSDVVTSSSGVFGSEQAALAPALAKHDRAEVRPTAQGLEVTSDCHGCGSPSALIIEWPELVALKFGVNPAMAFRAHPGALSSDTFWEFAPHERKWRPKIKCSKCGAPSSVRLAPEEPEGHLSRARSGGIIIPEAEQQISQVCQMAALHQSRAAQGR